MKTVVALALLVVACGVALAAVDNVIHEVRFADVYRHWSASAPSKSLTVYSGDAVLIRMNENPGTGYRWVIVEDFSTSVCSLQPTANNADGLYEPSTTTDGSDDKVVDGTARPTVPPGAAEWPFPYPWGDRRFDLRCSGTGNIVIKLRYKRSWETKYSWESQLNLNVIANT
mmetsp:Transcript_19545/g.45694  ORF Transcript_19545/g.45694 Transcript_19545/m.45694 type:complete len:171 (+) Transcript_19545:22-534(+)